MATVHMSAAEVARDLHAVLDKVRQVVEIVIEQDHRPVAEIVREANQRNSSVSLDHDVGKDLGQIQPWTPPSWV